MQNVKIVNEEHVIGYEGDTVVVSFDIAEAITVASLKNYREVINDVFEDEDRVLPSINHVLQHYLPSQDWTENNVSEEVVEEATEEEIAEVVVNNLYGDLMRLRQHFPDPKLEKAITRVLRYYLAQDRWEEFGVQKKSQGN